MTVLRVAAAAALLLVPVSETAHADAQPTATTEEAGFQGGPPGATPPSDPHVVPPTEIEGTGDGWAQFVEADARSGQGYVTPTAFTPPKGTGGVEAYMPVVPVGGVFLATYAVHDRVEIGAGALLVFEDSDDGMAGAFTAKVQALRSDRAALSVKLHHFRIPEASESLTSVTAVGSTCLARGCRVVASAHLTAVPIGDEDVLVLVGGGSLVAGGKLKMVAEVISFEEDDDQVLVGYGGVRLARPGFSLDLGFAAAEAGDGIDVLPVPLGAVSARF